MKNEADRIRSDILRLVGEYYQHAFEPPPFVPGVSAVPVAGRVFDQQELKRLIESSLDFWLTTGPFAESFEKGFAKFFGVRKAILVNSGSSANLLALTALTSPELGDRRLKPGDEVITVAAGFPTTVNPIIQNNMIPLFLDVDVPTYNIDVSRLAEALTDRTRAIMIAHTLGNPFNLSVVTDFAKKHSLWLIEDCCDAVGSTYDGKQVGTFGDIATTSFYPAHHITMGEGGCVLTNNFKLAKIIESFRDWGRDCWCAPGKADTCGKRFEWQVGKLPFGYDHKYIYSHIGYNLKATDMQAAVGVAQLEKLPGFIAARKKNFATLYTGLRDLEEHLLLPQATPQSDPSWFGFPIAVRDGSAMSCREMVRALNARKIATRLLFAGNLTRQPAYADASFRIVGTLERSDYIAERVFWVGVYPGITDSMLSYVIESLHKLCVGKGR